MWVDDRGNITRYNLAYINHHLFTGDNGRVVGFDNQHGYHHKHFMGETVQVAFVSFEELEIRFDQEWVLLHKGK